MVTRALVIWCTLSVFYVSSLCLLSCSPLVCLSLFQFLLLFLFVAACLLGFIFVCRVVLAFWGMRLPEVTSELTYFMCVSLVMMFASSYRIPVIEVSVIGHVMLCFSFVVPVSVACLLLLVSFVLFALSLSLSSFPPSA